MLASCITDTELGCSNVKEAARALFVLVGQPIRQQDAFAVLHRRHVEQQLASLRDRRLLEAAPDPREGCCVFVQNLRPFAAVSVYVSFSEIERVPSSLNLGSQYTSHCASQRNLKTVSKIIPQSFRRSDLRTSAALAQFNLPQLHDQDALAQLHRLVERRLLRIGRDFRLQPVLVVGVPGFGLEDEREGGR